MFKNSIFTHPLDKSDALVTDVTAKNSDFFLDFVAVSATVLLTL